MGPEKLNVVPDGFPTKVVPKLPVIVGNPPKAVVGGAPVHVNVYQLPSEGRIVVHIAGRAATAKPITILEIFTQLSSANRTLSIGSTPAAPQVPTTFGQINYIKRPGYIQA